jgi:acyl carrier protein
MTASRIRRAIATTPGANLVDRPVAGCGGETLAAREDNRTVNPRQAVLRGGRASSGRSLDASPSLDREALVFVWSSISSRLRLAAQVVFFADSCELGGFHITEEIRRILGKHARLVVDVADLKDTDDLFRLGMTSHASVNVMLALEDAFGVEFPEHKLRKSTFESVDSIRQTLTELLATTAGE